MLTQLAHHSLDAWSQAWPAFALVGGLLLVGGAAARDGVFATAGAFLARAPVGGPLLLVNLLGLEAVVAALLNLDTAVVFMTPVLLQVARQRGLAEDPFLYGAVLMANSGSLLLPGSNLTNLIVLSRDPMSGTSFAAQLAPSWVAAVGMTIVFVVVVFHRKLVDSAARAATEPPPVRVGVGAAGVVAAAVFMLVLPRPAVPTLVLGLAVALAARLRTTEMARIANPKLLLGLLALAVLLGTAARSGNWPGDLVRTAGAWESAWLAAAASVVVNNLPAAMVLSAHLPRHPSALLLGLDLGPNLAPTGSLSAIFWLQVARANGARPSALRYLLLGLAVVPLTLTAALLVTAA